MKTRNNIARVAAAVGIFLLALGICASSHAQQRMTIQATSMGTGTQLGRIFNVNIIIEQFSTAEDQKTLIDAFQRAGTDGIVNAVNRMTYKGRLSITGTVGNDVRYIKELPAENGARRIRLVTDRNISFAENRNANRSEQYSLSAVDLTITPDGKGTGVLLPACKLYVNKQGQIEIESWQNPWKLNNVMVHYDK